MLLQFLTLLNGDEIYVFCSDDKVARSGAISFSNVRCISVLSAFLRLKKELSWTIKDAEPYINSYLKLCFDHHQDTFKVQEPSSVLRVKKVVCRQVLEELFYDRFEDLKNGVLRYKKVDSET